MSEVLLVVAILAFIIVIVALNLAVGRLRSRFISWILGRVTRSMSWVTGPAAPTDAPGAEGPRGFGVLAGRNPEVATPRKRTGAGPVAAGAAIENLEDRDRK
jgi:hypothetical protein